MAYQMRDHGYVKIETATRSCHAANIFSDGLQYGTFQKLFPSFLQQWEVSRFLQPQGPLTFSDVKAAIHKAPPCISELGGQLQAICRYKNEKPENIPPKLSRAFADALRDLGGEAAANVSGKLVYRARLGFIDDQKGVSIRFDMAPPVIGDSCRLWREHGAEQRLLRVSVDEDTLRTYRNPTKGAWTRHMQEWLAKPLAVNGRLYRCFFSQDTVLYFFAESSLPNAICKVSKTISLHTLYQDILPLDNEYNLLLAIPKLSARIKLSLSKTEAVVEVPDVRWVPDLTNHTLCISKDYMAKIAAYFNLGYVPSCIAGRYRGKRYTWAILEGRPCPPGKIEIFSSSLGFDSAEEAAIALANPVPLQDDGIHVFFDVHKGLARKSHSSQIRIDFQHIIPIASPPEDHKEEIMTDGNALMSYALAKETGKVLQLSAIPVALQARIAGAKGVWNIDLNPDINNPSLWIEIRDSQLKYMVRKGFKWIFEVVNVSGPSSSKRIGNQMLRVLENTQQKEASSAISATLAAAREDEVLSAKMTDDKAYEILRRELEKCSNAKPASNIGEGARMRFGSREQEDLAMFEEKRLEIDPRSGRPDRWAAQAIALLDAGWSASFPIIRKLLIELEKMNEKPTKKDCQSDVSRKEKDDDDERTAILEASVYVYAITDQWGLLRAGEVYLNPTADATVDRDGFKRQGVLDENVLVSRYPCVQPTDIQKVKAVYKQELRRFQDVLICSTKGKMPLLQMLSGGDYDGDAVRVIYDAKLVDNWVNAPEKYISPPYEEEEFFATVPYKIANVPMTSGSHIVEALQEPGLDRSTEMQKLILTSMFVETSFGALSTAHSSVFKTHGIHDDCTREVGHLYTTSLDAPKAGKVLKVTVADLMQKYRSKLPLRKRLKAAALMPFEAPSRYSPERPMKAQIAANHQDLENLQVAMRPQIPPKAQKPSGPKPVVTPPRSPNSFFYHKSASPRRPVAPYTPGGFPANLTTYFQSMVARTPFGSPTKPSFADAPEEEEPAESPPMDIIDDALDDDDMAMLDDLPYGTSIDSDLGEPWAEAVAKSAILSEPDQQYLEAVEVHAKNMYADFKQLRQGWGRWSHQVDTAKKLALRRQLQHAELALIERYYNEMPQKPEVSLIPVDERVLAASCIWQHAEQALSESHKVPDLQTLVNAFLEFPFLLAFRTLCAIKCAAVAKQQSSYSLEAPPVAPNRYPHLGSTAKLPKRKSAHLDSSSRPASGGSASAGASPAKKFKYT